MTQRPVPTWSVAAVCLLLFVTASVMTAGSIALTADGPFNLVRLIADEEVFAPTARYLGSLVRQAPVLFGIRAGWTDTHALAILLGVGYLVVPAAVWCVAVALARRDALAFTAVAVAAGVCAVSTWFCSVSESVLALALTALVAVLLSRSAPWGWGLAALAAIASIILIASYETAVVTGAVMAVWAVVRARAATSTPDRVGGAIVAISSVAAIGVGFSGSFSGQNDSNSRSFLYFVVSLEPAAVYVMLLCGALLVAGLAIEDRRIRAVAMTVALAGALVAAAIFDLTPSKAYAARGAAVIAVFALQCLLAARWHRQRRASAGASTLDVPRWQLVLPVAFVAAMCATNLVALAAWSRGLDAFRAGVAEADGPVFVDEAVPSNLRQAVWGWTGTSLSLVVRTTAADGVLVDRNPSFVPFPPAQARAQIPDDYEWRR